MHSKAQNPPGLRRLRGKPIWRATKAAAAAGYPVKSVNLSLYAGDPAAIERRCQRLQIEMNSWLSGRRGNARQFDGTIRSLVDIYQSDPQSPYHGLPASTREPYDVYLRVLRAEVGERQIDRCDARDVKRWFAVWTAGGHMAKGKMIIAVLKTILSFGIQCRNAGCAEFKAILSEMKFPSLTDEGKQNQVMIGGPVQGKGPVKSEHTAYRADRVIVRDLRAVSVKQRK